MKIKTILFLLFLITYSFGSTNNGDRATKIFGEFLAKCKTINKIEYNVQRIDTFSQGITRIVSGNAYILKKTNDIKFGYYFSANNYELNYQSIYDGTNNFDIDTENKTYKLVRSINGSPGHQLVKRIADLIFDPKKEHNSVRIANETKDTYTIELLFDDKPNSTITDLKNTLVIDKITFLLIKLEHRGFNLGKIFSHQFILKNVNVNKDISTSIAKIKLNLQSFSQLPTEKKTARTTANLVDAKAPDFLLQNLDDTNSLSKIFNGRITLIDFWEVWCSHCVASMPKAEKLHKKYFNRLDLVGIVTESPKQAKILVNKFDITFNSLIGNKMVLKKYGVNSFPRYFLLDKNGIVKGEYFGFSPQIEKDIKQLLE